MVMETSEFVSTNFNLELCKFVEAPPALPTFKGYIAKAMWSNLDASTTFVKGKLDIVVLSIICAMLYVLLFMYALVHVQ